MSGYTVSYTVGRYTGTDKTALFIPRKVNAAKRAIIYAHGAGGDGDQPINFNAQPGLVSQMGRLAAAGFVILSADWGGQQTYGNDVEVAAMEAGWAFLQASGLCRNDKVILTGASMGSLSVHRFAADHPGSVAGINVWMPALSPDNLRDTNALATRDLVNAAWGLTAGSYPAAGGVPVPVRGAPLSRLADLGAIPTHAWYSTGDTVVPSTLIDTYLAGRPGVSTGHVVSSSLDHSAAIITASDYPTIQAFLQSVA